MRPEAGHTGPEARTGYAIAVTGLCLAWAAFAWPWLSGRYAIPWDAAAHFAPQVQFMAASFARGEWPTWNPYVFAGQAQVADPQSMLFSPPMVVLALVDPAPDQTAIAATVLVMLLAAGLGVLWLAADRGWHWAGGLVAALGLALGAAMAWRLQHFGQVFSLAYFPFALVCLERALNRSSIAYGTAAGLVAAVIVLGRDQVALLCTYLLVGRVVWHWLSGPIPRRIVESVPPLAAGAAVGGALVALPILMTLQLAELSNRPSIDFAGAAAGSLHPALLVTAAVPHLFGPAGAMADYWGPPSFTWQGTGLFIAQNMGIVYIGAVPLIALAIGLVRGSFADRSIRFLVAAFAFALLYALGGYTPAFRLFYEVLPGVDLFRRPADAVFLVGGIGALLAGYATHRLITDRDVHLSPAVAAGTASLIVLPFVAALAFAVALGRVPQALPALLAAGGWFAVAAVAMLAAMWLAPIRPIAAGLALALPLAADLAINNGPNGATAMPAGQLAMLDPKTDSATVRTLSRLVAEKTTPTHRPRIELAGLGFHWPNASMTHGLENVLGYNPVRLKIYSDATGAGDTVGLPDQRRFAPLLPGYQSLLADMLGLRFIATGVPIEEIDERLAPGALPLKARTPDAYIYENTGALPRVLFATRALDADFASIARSGRWPGFDPRTTVLLEAPSAPGRERRSAASIGIARYDNTDVAIDVESPDGGWLVLNDVWHPWWRAEIDGRAAPVLKANVLFRAVAVPPGRHRVRFQFRPIEGLVADLAHRARPGRRQVVDPATQTAQ